MICTITRDTPQRPSFSAKNRCEGILPDNQYPMHAVGGFWRPERGLRASGRTNNRLTPVHHPWSIPGKVHRATKVLPSQHTRYWGRQAVMGPGCERICMEPELDDGVLQNDDHLLDSQLLLYVGTSFHRHPL